MVKTLTGGGNADALHTHTAQQATAGGSCYTAWGTNACGTGYRAMYQGKIIAILNTAYGQLTGPICVANTTDASSGTSNAFNLMFNVNTNLQANFQNNTNTCAQCCP